MRKKLLSSIITIVFLLFSNIVIADGYEENYIKNQPSQVPVDGGIGLALIGGIGLYTRKKLKQTKNKDYEN